MPKRPGVSTLLGGLESNGGVRAALRRRGLTGEKNHVAFQGEGPHTHPTPDKMEIRVKGMVLVLAGI